MGEPKPAEPAADPPRPAVSVAGLTPMQQAYSDYAAHALGCGSCRDIDAGPCRAAEALWQAYRRESDDAYRRLSSNGQ